MRMIRVVMGLEVQLLKLKVISSMPIMTIKRYWLSLRSMQPGKTQLVLPLNITPTGNQSPVLGLQWEMFIYCRMADVSVARDLAYNLHLGPKRFSVIASRLKTRYFLFNPALLPR